MSWLGLGILRGVVVIRCRLAADLRCSGAVVACAYLCDLNLSDGLGLSRQLTAAVSRRL